MPFTFPLASSKQTWSGQGDALGGGTLPFLGIDALGVCFGMSAVWIKNNAPADARNTIKSNKDEVEQIQARLTTSSGSGEEHMMEFAGDDAELTVVLTNKYEAPVSHMILDLLGSTASCHHLIAFFYTIGRSTSGHAIAVSFDSATSGLMLDPNYGAGRYNSRTLLCNDLHRLLASYLQGRGTMDRIYVYTVATSTTASASASAAASTSSSSASAASSSSSSSSAASSAAATTST